MNNIPQVSRRNGSPLQCIRLSLGLLMVLGLTTPLFGCQNKQERCEAYVYKYNKCYRRSHQRAMSKYQKLPKAQQARIKPMLDALKRKIIDGDRLKQAIAKCIKQPPAAKRVKCLQRATCDKLSQCDPKRPASK